MNDLKLSFDKYKLFLLLAIILSSILGPAYLYAQDSSQVLPFDTYMDIVKEHHPLSKQADLQLERGDAMELKARGGFDPSLFAQIDQKYFEGKQYFSHLNSGLTIPTWYGIEVNGGYQANRGIFLDPEKTTPSRGLWYASISLPIGQGLFIDERRAELKKAKLYNESTEAERKIMLNKLMYEAGTAYWDWFQAYKNLLVYQNAVRAAAERLNAVKRESVLGNRPGIDTLEAGIQLQNRKLDLQEAELQFQNKGIRLSVYLWSEGVVPLEINEGTIPADLVNQSYQTIDESLLQALSTRLTDHPVLQQYRLQIDQMEIDRSLKAEQFKPRLNLAYKPLVSAADNEFLGNYRLRDYGWALEFKSPLFLRKERGAHKLAKIKLQEAELDIQNTQENLNYQAKASLNQWQTTIKQIQVYSRTVQDYQKLLEGERSLFRAGESSLFMVNSREINYINAQIKLNKLFTENQKAKLNAQFAFGILNSAS